MQELLMLVNLINKFYNKHSNNQLKQQVDMALVKSKSKYSIQLLILTGKKLINHHYWIVMVVRLFKLLIKAKTLNNKCIVNFVNEWVVEVL